MKMLPEVKVDEERAVSCADQISISPGRMKGVDGLQGDADVDSVDDAFIGTAYFRGELAGVWEVDGGAGHEFGDEADLTGDEVKSRDGLELGTGDELA
jgi:hypothetical protein